MRMRITPVHERIPLVPSRIGQMRVRIAFVRSRNMLHRRRCLRSRVRSSACPRRQNGVTTRATIVVARVTNRPPRPPGPRPPGRRG